MIKEPESQIGLFVVFFGQVIWKVTQTLGGSSYLVNFILIEMEA